MTTRLTCLSSMSSPSHDQWTQYPASTPQRPRTHLVTPTSTSSWYATTQSATSYHRCGTTRQLTTLNTAKGTLALVNTATIKRLHPTLGQEQAFLAPGAKACNNQPILLTPGCSIPCPRNTVACSSSWEQSQTHLNTHCVPTPG